jgi:hypothetical protein
MQMKKSTRTAFLVFSTVVLLASIIVPLVAAIKGR